MIGSLIAGTDEAPGKVVKINEKEYKEYRGMGSLSAMREGSRDRYGQSKFSDEELIPEGIEGYSLYRGPLSKMLNQLVGGLKLGMGYTGCPTIPDLQKKGKFVRVTINGLLESHARIG
jgi:IMP dehydrogenase